MDTQHKSRATAPCAEENSSPNPVNGALAHNPDDTYPQPLGSAALHGIAGDIVQLIEPHTEADPVAVLLQFLVAVGNVIGRGPGMSVDGAMHRMNLFGVLVGESAKGRKGSAWNQVINLMEGVDMDWKSNRVTSGLASAEGLIWTLRDSDSSDDGEDKRLLLVEDEFCKTLKAASRQGSSLSAVLRRAWDGADLRTITKQKPAKATGPHISVVGHISRVELRQMLNANEGANGFANRFLWVAVRRSKILPEGGQVDPLPLMLIASRVRAAIEFAKAAGQLQRSEEARELWRADYPGLSAGKVGLFGTVTSRAEAQVLRLSALFALLDSSKMILPEHHQAAMALWRYVEQSARWIFGTKTGDKNADKILAGLRFAAGNGMTTTEISERVFRHHAASEEICEALRLLQLANLACPSRRSTRGAPCTHWHATNY